MRHALARTAVGVGAGSVLAILLARSMRSLLFEVAPTDPLSYLSVAALLFALASIATLIPVARAILGDPLSALRES